MTDQELATDVSTDVPVAKLSENDKLILDNAKMKKELALANAKTALAQSESADVNYTNVILRLAMKYKLNEGDVVEDDGKIKRKA